MATQGTFDGVHFGHQKILKKVVEDASEMNAESVLLTFHPHPRTVLNVTSQIRQIQDMDDKIELLEQMGIDHLIVMKFDLELSQLEPLEFVKKIWVDGIKVNKFIIGYDHKFGKNRAGDIDFLTKVSDDLGFEVLQIDALDIENCIISSTQIRKAIQTGAMEIAASLLGRPFGLKGTVVRGKGLGKQLGFPTANIMVGNTDLIVPANGVYAVEISVLEKKYEGMLNIGTNPTFGDNKQTIEVNIFDFFNEIYNVSVKVSFFKKIRDVYKFKNEQELIKQLRKDEETVKNFFTENIYRVTNF